MMLMHSSSENMPLLETRQCDVCTDLPPIQIFDGARGDRNWQRHLTGSDHLSKAKAKKVAAAGQNLRNMFANQAAKQAQKKSQPLAADLPILPRIPQPLPLPPSSSISIQDDPEDSSPSTHQLNPSPPSPVPPAPSPPSLAPPSSPFEESQLPGTVDETALRIVAKMRSLTSSLPSSVRLATKDGPLAWMKDGAFLKDVSAKDAWEELDPKLNKFFHVSIRAEDIDAVMERGVYGVDALSGWFESAVRKYKLPASLIEEKASRIMDSLRRW